MVRELRGPRIAIDAMGGDHGVAVSVGGVIRAGGDDPSLRFVLYGDQAAITAALAPAAAALKDRCEIHHCDGVVAMAAPAAQALRTGRDSSMGRAIAGLSDGTADTLVSAGNTGALMAMALFRLRAAQGVERPALAALWPSTSAAGYNVVLDVGANLRTDARDLVVNALIGAEYARLALGIEAPRIGLLNIGSEDTKGRAEIRDAADRLRAAADRPDADFRFVGFIEGDGISGHDADVVVADGFSGNVALKTAEGVATLIGGYLRSALGGSLLGRLGALIASPALSAFKRRIDPRRVNGGVLLGLNGVVVKSHGGADAVAFAAAIALAARMGRHDISGRIAGQVARFVLENAAERTDPDGAAPTEAATTAEKAANTAARGPT